VRISTFGDVGIGDVMGDTLWLDDDDDDDDDDDGDGIYWILRLTLLSQFNFRNFTREKHRNVDIMAPSTRVAKSASC